MNELLDCMDYIKGSVRKKVRCQLKYIFEIILFMAMANVDSWIEVECIVHYHQEYNK